VPSLREPLPGAAQPKSNVRKSLDTTGFVRANVAEYDITEVCHRSRGRSVIRCPILALKNVRVPVLSGQRLGSHLGVL
jgi:hypothetical protein